MNKYYQTLGKILERGKVQTNKKGNIRYLLNEQLSLSPADLLDIFESHGIARKKLKNELQLFMQGERQVEKYREAGINWWDYCGSVLVNSYPTYFEKLPPLIARINREKRNSKNYVLFLGETGAESNQAPCLSLVQFQIDEGELVLSAYQRSSDANLGRFALWGGTWKKNVSFYEAEHFVLFFRNASFCGLYIEWVLLFQKILKTIQGYLYHSQVFLRITVYVRLIIV